MEATGNDYIYIDCFKNDIKYFKDIKKNVIEMSDRHFGIGGDGVIFICPSSIGDAKMIMYNIDGCEGLMCGNGIRCVAKYVYENIIKKKNLLIETKSGVKNVYINENDIIVDMGYPIFESKLIPVNIENPINKKVIIENNEFIINSVSMGNPHCIIFENNIDSIDIEYLGSIIQKSNIFPQQCNVSFVQILDKNKIKIRVYERGSGETLSCGTGACASVVMGVINKYLDSNNEIEVSLKGGKLYIKYDDKVYLRGNAKTIFKGNYLLK